ncbi:tyrosine-type recombinase/integrase [Bradyrhizobium arachidis]|uniref:Site-specific integrase n=1 Tax=Bradyrhizobium arachidis TaxID=858423 RepID=A0AAE7NQS3_9BRAD|nr:site-specific integrase [Bradyrhizobium arachidis]QOZ70288.1 site-specific integrase [Bradyrhizobium arachidis]SFU65724.1 Integrase [Bradyrhizobium arachidis]
MPKIAKELTALAVSKLKHPKPAKPDVPGSGGDFNAYFAVGGVAGLMLQITPNGGRSWVLRTTMGGKRRNMGLGSYPEVTLEYARNEARKAKASVRDGRDPIVEKKKNKAALIAEQKREMTFDQAMKQWLLKRLPELGSQKNKDALESMLNTYATPELGRLLVNDIAVQDVLRVLTPIWDTKTRTATRLRSEIERVLDWAFVNGHRSGDNPARWRGNLKEVLAKPSQISEVEHHPAVAIDEAPLWFDTLRKQNGAAAKALMFITLNASRSGEVRGMKWSEYDAKTEIWTVPADRIKMEKEHRILLSEEAIAILENQPRLDGVEYVFPSPSNGMLTDMAVSQLMKRMTKPDGSQFCDKRSKQSAVPHGLRSTFRDWVGDRTNYPREMGEVALAHKVGNETERAYSRSDMLEKRRHMMQDWANFLYGKRAQSDNVIDMTTATKKRVKR